VTKKIPKDNNNDKEVSKRASKNFGAKTEKEDSSSEVVQNKIRQKEKSSRPP